MTNLGLEKEMRKCATLPFFSEVKMRDYGCGTFYILLDLFDMSLKCMKLLFLLFSFYSL